MTPAGVAAAGADARGRAREEAIGWFVRLSSGQASDHDWHECQRWRAADPANEEAWSRVDAVRRQLSDVPGELASPVLRRPPKTRRQVLRALGVGLGTAGLAYGGWRESPWGTAFRADLSTAVGEQRSAELADGSQVVLNTRTAVDVRFDRDLRRLVLLAGEILVTTAHQRRPSAADDPRPLVVDTAQGRVRSLGTRFLVRDDGDEVRVSVLDSAVEVASARGGRATVRAGQQILMTRQGLGSLSPTDPAAPAWVSGSLVVDDARLADVLQELSRYRRGHLGCDPEVADLRVSGAFPIRDTDRALAALTASLPVSARELTPYWVTLQRRKS